MKKKLRKMTRSGSLLARLPLALAPLKGTLVEWEPANGSFYCNNHGARFSPTGDVIVGPALTALRPITVSVAADGSVTYSR